MGTAVTVDLLGNDAAGLDPATLMLIDPVTGEPATTVVVPGEGVWVVNDDGSVTFTPEDGFTGDPTPLAYQVASASGAIVESTVTIEYIRETSPPVAVPQVVRPSPLAPRAVAEPVVESVPVSQPLATTGAESQLLVTIGLLSLGAGFFSAGLSRRRRQQ